MRKKPDVIRIHWEKTTQYGKSEHYFCIWDGTHRISGSVRITREKEYWSELTITPGTYERMKLPSLFEGKAYVLKLADEFLMKKYYKRRVKRKDWLPIN